MPVVQSTAFRDNGTVIHPKRSSGDRDVVIGATSKSSADIILNGDGSAIFNEQGNDSDFRVEGSTDTNLFFVDASADAVGIGTNTPAETLEVSGTFGIDGNWVIDSESEATVERLRLQAVGANDPAELFLQAKGTANSSRITVTPDSSSTNYSGITMESDGTDQVIDSISEGTANALPLKLKMDGTDVITVQTDNDVIIENGSLGLGTTSPDQTLDVVGNLQVKDAESASKAYRFRTGGGALDLEAGGADIFLSVWSGADFTGSQHNQIVFDSGGGAMTFQQDIDFNKSNPAITMNSGQNFVINVSDGGTLELSGGAFRIHELSSDPSDPGEGNAKIWMSDGTGTGNDGDILVETTAGGVTETKKLKGLAYEIPIKINEIQTETSTSYTSTFVPVPFDLSKFDDDYEGIYFRASLTQGNSGTFLVSTRLYDVDAGSAVTGSELTADLAQFARSIEETEVTDNLGAGARNYWIQIKAESGGSSTIEGASIVVRY